MYKQTLIARLSSGLEGEELELFQAAAELCEATEEKSLAEVLVELRDGGADYAKIILSESEEDINETDEVDEDDDEDAIFVDEEDEEETFNDEDEDIDEVEFDEDDDVDLDEATQQSRSFGAAAKRSEQKRQVAIKKAKRWMKATGKSAEEAAKEHDLFPSDVHHLKTEEVEGLEELHRNTLQSYSNKAQKNIEYHGKKADRAIDHGNEELFKKSQNKIFKRVAGVQTASKKLAKETTEYHGFNTIEEESGNTHIFSGNSSFMKKHLKDVASAHGATVKKVRHEDGVSEYHVHTHPSVARKMGDELEKRDETQFNKNKVEHHYGGYFKESYSETIMNRLSEIGKIDEKYSSIEDKAVSIEEDVTAMFEGMDLTEDFKEKASLIFEAAVARQVNAYKELVNEAIDDVVEEEVEVISEALTEKINKYLDYVVEEWAQENEVAIETGLRVKVAEDFISGLKNLFAEHYIEVPEGKENILDTVVAEKEGIEEEFEKAVLKNIELVEEIKELKKGVILSEMTRDLADTEAEKLEELVDGVDFVNADDFASKVGQIKESYFNRAPRASSQVIDESEIVTPEVLSEETSSDPKMKAYMDGLSKFIK